MKDKQGVSDHFSVCLLQGKSVNFLLGVVKKPDFRFPNTHITHTQPATATHANQRDLTFLVMHSAGTFELASRRSGQDLWFIDCLTWLSLHDQGFDMGRAQSAGDEVRNKQLFCLFVCFLFHAERRNIVGREQLTQSLQSRVPVTPPAPIAQHLVVSGQVQSVQQQPQEQEQLKEPEVQQPPLGGEPPKQTEQTEQPTQNNDSANNSLPSDGQSVLSVAEIH